MPRSSDTRCLHCNGKIPLLQRLKNSQFCSTAHEQTYRTEQQELAVERLHQTHDSLQAYKPPEDVESILGPLSIPPAPTPSVRNTIGGIANAGAEESEPSRKPPMPAQEKEAYNPDEPADFRPSWEKLSGETMYTEEERQAPPRPQSQPDASSSPTGGDEISELDQFLRDTEALDKFSSKDLDLDDLSPENLNQPLKPDPSAARYFMPQPKRPEPEPVKNDFTESLLDRLGVNEEDAPLQTPPPPVEEPTSGSPLDRLMDAAPEPVNAKPDAAEPEEPALFRETGPESSRMAELVSQAKPEGPYGVLAPATPTQVDAEPEAFVVDADRQGPSAPAETLLGDVTLNAPDSAFAAQLPLVSDAQSLEAPASRGPAARAPQSAELELEASAAHPAGPCPVDLEAVRPEVLSAAYLEQLTQPAAPEPVEEPVIEDVQEDPQEETAEKVAEVAIPENAAEEISEPEISEEEIAEPAVVASEVVESDEPIVVEPELVEPEVAEPEVLVGSMVTETLAEDVVAVEEVAAAEEVAEEVVAPVAESETVEASPEPVVAASAPPPTPEPEKPVSGVWISADLFGSSKSRVEKVATEQSEVAEQADVTETSDEAAELKAEADSKGAEEASVPAEPVATEPVAAAPEVESEAESTIDEAEPVLAAEETQAADAVSEPVEASKSEQPEQIAAEFASEDTTVEEAEEISKVEEIEALDPSMAALAALLGAEPRDSEPSRSGDTDEAEPVSFEPDAGLPKLDVEPEAVPVPSTEEEEPEPAWASTLPLPRPSAVPALRGKRGATEVDPLETEELLIWADLEMTPAVSTQRDLWRLNESLCALDVQLAAPKPAGPKTPMPAPLTGTILFPKVRLEPEPFKSPTSGGMDQMMGPPPRKPGGGSGANRKKRKSVGPGGMLGGVKGFWNHAPRDLKILLLVIPVLLALVFHPSLPKISVAAPDTSSGVPADVKSWFDDSWTEVRAAIAARAGVALEEDFRQGLDQWISRGGATTHWSFDPTGFVQPGPLALYAPSMNLVDYQMQFLGMIDKGALSWVVRAKDFRNYYVVKLVERQSGALPIIFVTRYAVIDGVAMDRVDTRVPIDARADTLYRVRMDVQGDDFTLAVQDQVVDTWEEPRLNRGGIGFFTGRGEESRVRWVQLTHQYDTLGRLCAYLAPYNPSPAAGGEVAGSY